MAKKRKAKDGLASALANVTEEDALKFLEEALKPAEFKNIKRRWKVLYRIARAERTRNGDTHTIIASECGVSQAVVTHVRQRMYDPNGVCRRLVEIELSNEAL